jgi:hypothetical protein
VGWGGGDYQFHILPNITFIRPVASVAHLIFISQNLNQFSFRNVSIVLRLPHCYIFIHFGSVYTICFGVIRPYSGISGGYSEVSNN